MDGVPYDLTERQVYEVGQQVAAALVGLLMLAALLILLAPFAWWVKSSSLKHWE